ncbi:MAG: hypothetical protein D6808_01165 [Candidatus Dadabacteria bacterium]|nr:MAG: hypothetical protein D6808_01165 [Candidatus Dadabacteria bacterium]
MLSSLEIPFENICYTATIQQAAAIMKRCAFGLGVENYFAQLARAVKLPGVVIEGGGDFGRFFPNEDLTTIISNRLECFGWGWKCRHDVVRCIKDIDPEEVVRACEKHLANR